LRTKARPHGQECEYPKTLFSSVKSLCISLDDACNVKVQKWVKLHAVIFSRLKETQVNSFNAATTLKVHLPECMKNITDPVDDIKDPYELAQIVEEVILGDIDFLMVTTDSLLNLLVNKFPTPAETIKFLKFLCLYNSRNEDAAFLWCKFAMYLVPENSRRKMCELPEYVNKDYQGVWNRLFGKISAVVSYQKYSAFRLQNYYSRVTKGTEDYLFHKRPRMKENFSCNANVNDRPLTHANSSSKKRYGDFHN